MLGKCVKMLSFVSKTILFYFAYLPLAALLLVQNLDINIKLLAYLIILFLSSYIPTRLLFKEIASIAPRVEEINIISEKNSETLSFIVTYIIPLCVPLTNSNNDINLNNFISLIILFLIIYYLYIETSLFCINPLLKILFKYNVYQVELHSEKYFLLSKRVHSNRKKSIRIKKLSNNLLIEEDE